jgi:hypothetical protein
VKLNRPSKSFPRMPEFTLLVPALASNKETNDVTVQLYYSLLHMVGRVQGICQLDAWQDVGYLHQRLRQVCDMFFVVFNKLSQDNQRRRLQLVS